jgi:hypothetical protein
MILDVDGQAFLRGIETRALRDGPALQRTVQFEPKIIMEAGSGVFLNDVHRRVLRSSLSRMAGRLRGLHEVALSAISL